MSLPSRLLGANPSIQVSTLLSGTLTTPSARGTFELGSFESIASTTAGSGGVSSVTFSSIPATYTHLQIRFLSRSDRASGGDYFSMRFNADAGANYYLGHQLQGNGATPTSYANGSGTSILVERVPSADSPASCFAVGVLDILDYANTNKYKTTRSVLGFDGNGSGVVNFASGAWFSNTAISNIVITMVTGLHVQYSRFALYGIKG